MLILTTMFLFLLCIPILLMILNLIISKKNMINSEKSSPFECGFDPYSNPRLPFSIQFYMISMIFLIFDIEIIIMLPVISSFSFNIYKFWLKTISIFIIILLIGLYMEWNDGAFKWLK